MDEALCRGADPTEFFPSDGVGVDLASQVCTKCSVRAECLEYALAHRIEHGVWGGASERERRRIQRRRRSVAAGAGHGAPGFEPEAGATPLETPSTRLP